MNNYMPIITPTIINICKSNFDLSKIDEKYKNSFQDIYDSLYSIKDINLEFFKENVKDVIIIEKNNIYNNRIIKVRGSYNYLKNKITLTEKDKTKILYHEILHLASSTQNGTAIHLGFRQITYLPYLSDIGAGINEGYTAYLNETRFRENNLPSAYQIEKAIILLLEIIVEKNTLQNLYFNADLYGLVQELQKYTDLNNVITFITNVDYINKKAGKIQNQLQLNKAIDIIRQIKEFFIKCVYKKSENNIYKDKINLKFLKIIYDMEENYKEIFSSLYSIKKDSPQKFK